MVAMGEFSLEQLTFGDYWPPGTPDLVRAFLKTKYDPETMPALHVAAAADGTFRVLGWSNEHGEPSLLEASRGWALTENEAAWAEFLAQGRGTGS